MISEHFFPDRNSLVAALGASCETLLGDAIKEKQRATLLVSGGSTPQPLYQQLSRADLDWSAIDIALVDERWVGADHSASNAAFIHKQLLQNKAANAHFTPMKTPANTATMGQVHCEQQYQQLSRPFDVTILGMGLDGHTASLFPHAQGLDKAMDTNSDQLCATINAEPSAVTGEFTERMSLTLAALLQSRQLHLLITGEEKLSVYRRALENPDSRLMPISALLQQQQTPVLVYWAP